MSGLRKVEMSAFVDGWGPMETERSLESARTGPTEGTARGSEKAFERGSPILNTEDTSWRLSPT